jgi:hypothetical protein
MDGASPAAIAAALGDTPETTIADDLLSGCPEIGAYIGKSPRETLWAIERGWIPAWREGHKWCALKSALRKHYAELATKMVDPKALAAERDAKGYRKREPSMPEVSMDTPRKPLRRRRVA